MDSAKGKDTLAS